VTVRNLVTVLAVLVVAVILGIAIQPYALTAYHLQAGDRALQEAKTFAATRPEDVNPALDRAIQHFQQALAHRPQDGYAHRKLGQAWLLLGDNERAVQALSQAAQLRPNHPLIHIELGYAYDGLGQVDRALAEYERGGYGPAVEAAIANYLKVVDWQIAAGGGDEALGILEDKVFELDPDNLPALYRAMRIYESMGQQAAVEFAEPLRQRLRYFALQSVTLPVEPRQVEYLAQTMVVLVDEGIWEREVLPHVVSYQIWQADGSALAAQRLLDTLLERWPQDPTLLSYVAEVYLLQGNPDQAQSTYQAVLDLTSDAAPVCLRLGVIAETRLPPQLGEAAHWYEQYHRRRPDDLLGLRRLARVCLALAEADVENASCREAAARVSDSASHQVAGISPGQVLWTEWLERVAVAEPKFPAQQELEGGWTYLGFDRDEDRLICDRPVDLLLYWKGPPLTEAGAEQDGWYQAGDRWVQVLEGARNLVPNGGFELGVENGSPTGFPYDIYGADPDTRRLVTDRRAGQRTTVALLDSTPLHSSASFVSTYVPADPDKLYLQAGWMRGVGGNGFLGRRWAGGVAEGVRPYSYVAAGVSPDSWQYYSEVTRPLPGTTRCRMMLINHESVGQVYFDDLLFLEVSPPGK
jgi:tetratricopeptide (TPR) repeat protein